MWVPSPLDLDCVFRGLPIVISTSGHAEIFREDIVPETLCGMIQNSIPCPKGSPGMPHQRDTLRVCANRKGKTFSILMVKDFTVRFGVVAYLVTHVKPI